MKFTATIKKLKTLPVTSPAANVQQHTASIFLTIVICCRCTLTLRSSNEQGLIKLFYLFLRWLSLCQLCFFFSFLCYQFFSYFPNTLLLSPPVHVLTSLLPPNSQVRFLSLLLDWSSCFLFNGIDTLLIFLFWPWAIVGNQFETQDKVAK